ncbi:uncharacterized protein LOC135927127 [Gordionus sp. m RMFG-2023]|uniref:uncharacterized protein LOC135927127 n=1 Tax=Gordionus sp. m RMFG-2023 TaxID=3053472 RepID=UPI0031FD52CF
MVEDNIKEDENALIFKVTKYSINGGKPVEFVNRDVPVNYSDNKLIMSCQYASELKSRYIALLRAGVEDETALNLISKTMERPFIEIKIIQSEFGEKAFGPYICGLMDENNLIRNRTIYLSLKLPLLSQPCIRDNDCRMISNAKCEDVCTCKSMYKQSDSQTECSNIFAQPTTLIICAVLFILILLLLLIFMIKYKKNNGSEKSIKKRTSQNEITELEASQIISLPRRSVNLPMSYPPDFVRAQPKNPNSDGVKGKNKGVKTDTICSKSETEYDSNYDYDFTYKYIPPERDISFYHVDPFYLAPFQNFPPNRMRDFNNSGPALQNNPFITRNTSSMPQNSSNLNNPNYKSYPYLNSAFSLSYLK